MFSFSEVSWIGGSVSIYFLIGRDRVCMGAIDDAALEGNTHRKFENKLMPKEIPELLAPKTEIQPFFSEK